MIEEENDLYIRYQLDMEERERIHQEQMLSDQAITNQDEQKAKETEREKEREEEMKEFMENSKDSTLIRKPCNYAPLLQIDNYIGERVEIDIDEYGFFHRKDEKLKKWLPKTDVCMFFLSDLCDSTASKCRFLHYVEDKAIAICHKHLKCGHMDSCRYRHLADDEKKECSNYTDGFCEHGGICRWSHKKKSNDELPDENKNLFGNLEEEAKAIIRATRRDLVPYMSTIFPDEIQPKFAEENFGQGFPSTGKYAHHHNPYLNQNTNYNSGVDNQDRREGILDRATSSMNEGGGNMSMKKTPGNFAEELYKTSICTKWLKGTCTYGDRCVFAHGEHELRDFPPGSAGALAKERETNKKRSREGDTYYGDSREKDFGFSEKSYDYPNKRGRYSNDANDFRSEGVNQEEADRIRSAPIDPSILPAQPDDGTRYFVIKSSEWKTLAVSVKRKEWVTHTTNQFSLNSAFQESRGKVILFFSVNESRCFQGVAKMEHAIRAKDPNEIEELKRKHQNNPKAGDIDPSIYSMDWTHPFPISWCRTVAGEDGNGLGFRYISHIKNPYNHNQPVSRARDCQEVASSEGYELLCCMYRANEQLLEGYEFEIDDAAGLTFSEKQERDKGEPLVGSGSSGGDFSGRQHRRNSRDSDGYYNLHDNNNNMMMEKDTVDVNKNMKKTNKVLDDVSQ